MHTISSTHAHMFDVSDVSHMPTTPDSHAQRHAHHDLVTHCPTMLRVSPRLAAPFVHTASPTHAHMSDVSHMPATPDSHAQRHAHNNRDTH
jgi:hypothetical protein